MERNMYCVHKCNVAQFSRHQTIPLPLQRPKIWTIIYTMLTAVEITYRYLIGMTRLE